MVPWPRIARDGGVCKGSQEGRGNVWALESYYPVHAVSRNQPRGGGNWKRSGCVRSPGVSAGNVPEIYPSIAHIQFDAAPRGSRTRSCLGIDPGDAPDSP